MSGTDDRNTWMWNDEAEQARLWLDRAVYGVSFTDVLGNRIDPATVQPSGGDPDASED